MEIGKLLYKNEISHITIKLTKQEVLFDTVIVSYDLLFDNTAYKEWSARQAMRKEQGLPVKVSKVGFGSGSGWVRVTIFGFLSGSGNYPRVFGYLIGFSQFC